MEELINIVSNMTVGELLGGAVGIVALLSVFVEITPVKFNPVSSFLAWFGRKTNGELIEKVSELDEKVNAMQAHIEEGDAIDCRVRILRFGDEIYHGVKHSKEHFDQILEDIGTYENYCSAHKEFKNNKTCSTTAKILETYENCFDEHDFL